MCCFHFEVMDLDENEEHVSVCSRNAVVFSMMLTVFCEMLLWPPYISQRHVI